MIAARRVLMALFTRDAQGIRETLVAIPQRIIARIVDLGRGLTIVEVVMAGQLARQAGKFCAVIHGQPQATSWAYREF